MRCRLFTLLLAAMVALGINGCAGEGKSYDPLGTDSLTFGDSSGSTVIRLDTSGSIQLTAKVKDAAGKAVADREVFFDVVPNASGATISATKVVTNAAGEAAVLYRAGTASGVDVVRAFLSNGIRMDVNVTVSGIVEGARIALAAAPASLAAGQNSILTATVTNSAGTPLKGQPVTFAFASNSSGAALATVSGTTDVSGRAVAVYTAGGANSTASLQDTVQAAVAGSADALVITRTAAAGGGGITVSLASSVTSLAAGQIALLTATVTDGASAPVSGQAVTFAFSANNSGAQLVVLNGTTDISGKAVAQYTAGANSPTVSVQDTVLASVAGSAAAVVITRTVGTTTGFQIDVTATTTRLNAGDSSVITATVRNADGTVAPGQPVSFAFLAAPSGATLFTINSGVTDVSGKAVAVYTAGAFSPTLNLQDTVLASTTGTAGVVIITRLAASGAGNRISSLTAIPSTLPSGVVGGTSIITATVVGGDGITPVPSIPVTFSVLVGVGTFANPNAVTGNDGRAVGVFTGSGAAPNTQSVVRAAIAGSDAVTIINWQ
jgi:hypothetical protein